MAKTLQEVLSALHGTDKALYNSLSGLKYAVSGSWESGKVAIGTGAGLSASSYSIGTEGLSDSATLIPTEAVVSAFVQGKINEFNTQTGDALTGLVEATNGAIDITNNGAAKNSTIGIKVDGSTIKVNGSDALTTDLTLSAITTAEGAASTYALVDGSGTTHGSINIPKDQFLSAAVYNSTTESIDLTFAISGEPNLTSIPVADLAHEYANGNGIAITPVTNGNSTIAVKVKEGDAYLSATTDGLAVQAGVDDAISAAIDANNAALGLTGNSGINSQLSTLSSALTDYLGENAVSAKFAAIEGKLGSHTANDILLAGSDGAIVDSEKQFETTLTDSDAKIATSKAVSSFVADKTQDMVTNTTDFNASGRIVLTDGSAHNVAQSEYTITADDANAALTGTSTIATAKDIKAYVDGKASADLSGKIDTVTTAVEGNVPKFNGNGNLIDSTFKIGATDDSSFGASNELAVESAVSAFFDTKAANFVSGTGMTSGQIVLAKGEKEVETTGKTIVTDFTTKDDNKVPTVKAVDDYVTDGLEELYGNVTALTTAVGTI